MAEWWMDDFEIAQLYRQAKDRVMQLQILAELNVTTTRKMAKKLVSINVLTEEEAQEVLKQLRDKNPAALSVEEDEIRMDLYEQRYSDKAIAEKIGVTRHAIRSWRERRGLPSFDPTKDINGNWHHLTKKSQERKSE